MHYHLTYSPEAHDDMKRSRHDTEVVLGARLSHWLTIRGRHVLRSCVTSPTSTGFQWTSGGSFNVDAEARIVTVATIRLKSGTETYHVPYVRQAKGRWHSLSTWPLSPGQTPAVGWVRLTQKQDYGWLWLVLHWETGQEQPWYLVSDQPDTRGTIRGYHVRMLTEEMYADLKGHGFDLEATHLQDTNRLARLFLAVALVYTWLLTLGAWVVKRGFRLLVDRKERRDKSFFRIGWDWLERQLALGLPLKLSFVPYP